MMNRPAIQRAFLRKEQAWGLYSGAVLALLFMPIDLYLYGWDGRLFAVRALWTVIMLAGGVVVQRGSVRAIWATILLSGSASTLCFAFVIGLTGGLQSPYVLWLCVFPCLLAPLSRMAAALSAAIVVGSSAVFFWEGNRYFTGLGLVALAGVFAVYTAYIFHGLRKKERALDAERLSALEQLGESERRRLQAERMALVGQLAAGVAHEINNPLAFVTSNVRFIGEEANALGEEERAEVLQETMVGLKRIADIVADLKGFSRDPGQEREVCDVALVLAEAARLGRVRTGELATRLDLDVAPALPLVPLARRKVEQVVLNLVVNATEALEAAKTPRGEGRVQVSARAEGDRLVIEVEDNGPGIPDEVAQLMFEPFFTTKPVGKGTGLGLALCREYVTQMGGTLTHAQVAPHGARFCIRLPLNPPAAANADAHLAHHPRSHFAPTLPRAAAGGRFHV